MIILFMLLGRYIFRNYKPLNGLAISFQIIVFDSVIRVQVDARFSRIGQLSQMQVGSIKLNSHLSPVR